MKEAAAAFTCNLLTRIHTAHTHVYIVLALTRKIINHSSISERLGVNTLTLARVCVRKAKIYIIYRRCWFYHTRSRPCVCVCVCAIIVCTLYIILYTCVRAAGTAAVCVCVGISRLRDASSKARAHTQAHAAHTHKHTHTRAPAT